MAAIGGGGLPQFTGLGEFGDFSSDQFPPNFFIGSDSVGQFSGDVLVGTILDFMAGASDDPASVPFRAGVAGIDTIKDLEEKTNIPLSIATADDIIKALELASDMNVKDNQIEGVQLQIDIFTNNGIDTTDLESTLDGLKAERESLGGPAGGTAQDDTEAGPLNDQLIEEVLDDLLPDDKEPGEDLPGGDGGGEGSVFDDVIDTIVDVIKTGGAILTGTDTPDEPPETIDTGIPPFNPEEPLGTPDQPSRGTPFNPNIADAAAKDAAKKGLKDILKDFSDQVLNFEPGELEFPDLPELQLGAVGGSGVQQLGTVQLPGVQLTNTLPSAPGIGLGKPFTPGARGAPRGQENELIRARRAEQEQSNALALESLRVAGLGTGGDDETFEKKFQRVAGLNLMPLLGKNPFTRGR